MSASATSALALPAGRPPTAGSPARARALGRGALRAVLAIGTVTFLLNRGAVAGLGAGALLLGYAAMTFGSVALAGGKARTAAASPRSRIAPPDRWIPLAVGIGAVVFARAASGAAPPVPITATIVTLNVAAALAEEAFFRGFLFARLRPWGVAVAVAVTAIAFAVIHLPLYGVAALPVDLGAGMLLSWQRAASRTWAAPAATHALANALAVLR
jgi:membrane protease YdiL (CAAX protease family)